MPKKESHNAFYYFMLDYMVGEKKRGHVFPNGLKDVQADPKCTEIWTNMPKADKSYYLNKAKGAKFAANKKGKLTGTGESIDELEMEERRKKEFLLKMNDDIAQTINDADRDKKLTTKVFYFIHVNYFYAREVELNNTWYAPAEFAVIRFSLVNGIEDIYHKIIKCKPHMGYTFTARNHSKLTHQIPLQYEKGEDNYARIYGELMAFLKRTDKNLHVRTPIYTMTKSFDVVRCFLDQVAEAAEADMENIPIYSLEKLFSEMRTVCQKMPIPVVLAHNDLIKDVFSFANGIDCEFHRDMDGTTPYCSMSIVKRWVYTLCDCCCEPANIKMKEGIHYPFSIPKKKHSVTALAKSFSTCSISERSRSTTGRISSMSGRASISSVEERLDKVCDYSSSQSEISEFSFTKTQSDVESVKSYAKAGFKGFNLANEQAAFPPLGRGAVLNKKKELISKKGCGRGSLAF